MNIKKRNSLSVREKASILEEAEKFTGTNVELSKKLRLPVSTLQTILKNKEFIKSKNKELGVQAKKRKTLKGSPYDELESILVKFFHQSRTSNLPINGTILREKALEIAGRLNVKDFKASNGWIDRFKKRNNLVYRSLPGESRSGDLDTVERWKESLPEIIKHYEPKNIFGANETGLFYNLMPDKSYFFNGESCHDGKLPEMRLTVLLCVNADGSNKMTPLVIGNACKPHCFKKVQSFPTEYASNKNAWMTTDIFQGFLRKFDEKMRLEKRNVILFLNQCNAHVKLNLKNVRIEFFPANYTSKNQPLDFGVVRAFKVNYRKELIRKAIAEFENAELACTIKINVLEAMRIIASAWHNVSPTCIEHCFRKCGLSVSAVSQATVSDTDSQIEAQDKTLEFAFDIFVDCDSDVLTSKAQTIGDFIKEECSSEGETDSDEDIEIPTFDSALTGLRTMQKYLQTFTNQETNLVNLAVIENELYKLHEQKAKQDL